jgi:ribonuclease HII
MGSPLIYSIPNLSMPVKKKSLSVLGSLLSFDQSMMDNHSHLEELRIIGVDEVGIGCLAGPVVAAATILPDIPARSKLAKNLSRLNDSKKLDHGIRKDLAVFIREHAHYAVGHASVEEIDELNILQAGLLAMKRAVFDLNSKLINRPKNVLLLVDGNKKIPDSHHQQLCIIQGDSQSASIAAASVVAKVFRDQWMDELALDHPHYLWHSNKGYGSPAHRKAIAEHGLCKWHRRSFTERFSAGK